jgi:hypothetical protein
MLYQETIVESDDEYNNNTNAEIALNNKKILNSESSNVSAILNRITIELFHYSINLFQIILLLILKNNWLDLIYFPFPSR